MKNELKIVNPEYAGAFHLDDKTLAIYLSYKPNIIARFIWKQAGFTWRPVKIEDNKLDKQ